MFDKELAVISVALLFASIFSFSFNVHPVKAQADLEFSDGFESGWDIWTYDSPYRYEIQTPHLDHGPWGTSGTNYTLESVIVHSGGYAAKFTLPAIMNSWANVYKTINYTRTLYMSGWFMFDASIPIGSYLLVGPCICGYSDRDLVCGYLYNSNGTLKWSMQYYTNAGPYYGDGNFATSDLGPNVQINVWYNVQVMVTVSTNGSGEAAMWAMQQGQGQFTEIAHVTGLTNDGDRGPNGEIGVRNLQVGPYVPYTWASSLQQAFAVTAWYDDTFASTTFISVDAIPEFSSFAFFAMFILSSVVILGTLRLKSLKSKPRR